MAVAPTGAIYKALKFDGVSSRTYGVYITGEAVYNAPERDVEMITIPGRSGSFALDNGRFENITVTYPAGIFAETEADFREAISEFRNFLCSRKGYVRLQDEYNPNEYRMAVYKSGLEVEPAMLKAGEFEIIFDCKPQRWLTSGETAVTIANSGDTITNPTLFDSGPLIEIEGYGAIGFNGFEVELENAMLGPVTIFNGGQKPPLDTSVNIASSLYNIGDTITVLSGGTFNEVILRLYSNLSYSTYDWGNINNIVGGQVGRGQDQTLQKLLIEVYVKMPDMVITAGTNSSKTDTLTCQVEYLKTSAPGTIYTTNLTVTVIRTYDAATDTITWSYSATDTGSKFDPPTLVLCGCGDIVADSTISIIGNPTYIDCEIGEAYKFENDEFVSLNSHVDLGSKLPTLAPGANTITFDNTITDLKIAPRWWKV